MVCNGAVHNSNLHIVGFTVMFYSSPDKDGSRAAIEKLNDPGFRNGGWG